MTITISYDPYQSNWYVGELYKTFHEYLINKKIDITYIHIKDLAKQHNESFEYINNLPSVFSIYSLIITDNNKTFVHNLSDYAPAILEHDSAIDKLNIKAFGITSNLTANVFNLHANKNFIIHPSFYILENYNDYNRILKYQDITNKKNNCCFNGLLYGIRQQYSNVLTKNNFFHILNKSNSNDYQDKDTYYKYISGYRYGLSLNGAAQICYRDLEYFGVKNLCLREKLNIITHNPLIENYHYKTIIDDDIYYKIYNKKEESYILNKIKDIIENISIEEIQFVTHNAQQWFFDNVKLENQLKILNSFIEKTGII